MELNKRKIEEYIKELSRLNDFIENIENDDLATNHNDFNNQLSNVLQSLNNDIISPNINEIYEVKPLEIKIKKIDEKAIIPSYAITGDAGLDLTAISIISESDYQITYGTGLKIEIPDGYVGLIFPRSSIRYFNLSLSNCVGVIDSGFRGEITLTFTKVYGSEGAKFKYNINDRIGQIIILPYPKIQFIETETLSETERDINGFGSTNKK